MELLLIYDLPTPKGWKAELASLPMKWSHVNHGSGVDQGKSASYRPTFLPLSHAANSVQEVNLSAAKNIHV